MKRQHKSVFWYLLIGVVVALIIWLLVTGKVQTPISHDARDSVKSEMRINILFIYSILTPKREIFLPVNNLVQMMMPGNKVLIRHQHFQIDEDGPIALGPLKRDHLLRLF